MTRARMARLRPISKKTPLAHVVDARLDYPVLAAGVARPPLDHVSRLHHLGSPLEAHESPSPAAAEAMALEPGIEGAGTNLMNALQKYTDIDARRTVEELLVAHRRRRTARLAEA